MQDNQRRRITFGIISLLVGLVVANMGIQTAIRNNAQETSAGGIVLVGVAVGVALVAAGVYLILRFFQERARG